MMEVSMRSPCQCLSKTTGPVGLLARKVGVSPHHARESNVVHYYGGKRVAESPRHLGLSHVFDINWPHLGATFKHLARH